MNTPAPVVSSAERAGRRFPRAGKQLAAHAAFWGAYAGLEYLANAMHYEQALLLWRDILASLPILMGAAYFTAYVLVPQLLWKGRKGAFLLAALLVLGVVYAARWQWTVWTIFWDEGYRFELPAAKILKNVIRDYALIALGVCLKIIADWDRRERLHLKLQLEKQEAELQFLRAQIHPHFLFNTLNNLYGLALRKSEQTAEGILRLSGLLDFMLYNSKAAYLPLIREIEVIQQYVELERLRYGDRLTLDLDLNPTDREAPVAPLLLLPFVENCFKHGAATDDGKVWIALSAYTKDGVLIFRSENSRLEEKSSSGSSGLGLENVRRRLAILYAGRHELCIQSETDSFTVELRLRYGA